MAPVTFNTHSIKRAKRQLFKFNLGGSEHVPRIDGNQNQINYHGGPKTLEEPTLLRHTGDQVRKLIEGGTDVVLAPAKWLAHMQENWLTYLVCTAVLIVCILIIYFCSRRKASTHAFNSFAKPNLSAMIMEEAMKLASLQHNVQAN